MGFVVDKVTLGQVFSEYFCFPCQFSFHRLLHTHHLSSGAGTIGQLVADVPSGLSLHPKKQKKKAQLNSSGLSHVTRYDISPLLFMKCVLPYNTLVEWTVQGMKLKELKLYFPWNG
jgi:hypothetical protein